MVYTLWRMLGKKIENLCITWYSKNPVFTTLHLYLHYGMEVYLFSRWSVHCAPTGHRLFTLSSSLAGSWEESRRKLISWSFRAHSLVPPGSSVAFTATRPGQSECLLRGNKTSAPSGSLSLKYANIMVSIFISGRCLLIFVKANSMNLLF